MSANNPNQPNTANLAGQQQGTGGQGGQPEGQQTGAPGGAPQGQPAGGQPQQQPPPQVNATQIPPELQQYVNHLVGTARQEGRNSAEQAAKGQFEQLWKDADARAEREKSRADTATAQLAALQGRYDTLLAAFNTFIDSQVTAATEGLADEVKANILKLKPQSDDPQVLTAFVTTAQSLATAATNKPARPGLGEGPPPAGDPKEGQPDQQTANTQRASLINTNPNRYGGF